MLNILSAVKNWWSYDGARRGGTDRGYIPGYVQDARFDVDNASRIELIRKSRASERNNGMFNRIVDVFEQFTVGTGVQIIPATEDDGFNERVSESWQNWQRYCDLTSLQPFPIIQSLIARTWFVDGSMLVIKTRGQEQPGQPPRPRIQTLEPHRLGTPPELYENEGKTIIDGVEVNPLGRPIAYHIIDGLDGETYRRIPASNVIHVYEPHRAGAYHGLPFVTPVINDLIDLEDLELLEQRAAKDAAEKSTFILNQAGEVDTQRSIRERFNTANQTAGNGTEITQERLRRIRSAIGGRMEALKIGEDVKQFVPQRPSAATREYWDYKVGKVCAGVGVSKLLVFPYSIQGTVARGDWDVSAGFFRSRSAVIADASVRIYHYWLGWAVDNEPALAGPRPKDWLKVTVRAPRAVNADVGYNSSAMIALLESGATTLDAYYGSLGLDWKDQIRQRGQEEKFINKVAKDLELTPDRIRKEIGESIKLQRESKAA